MAKGPVYSGPAALQMHMAASVAVAAILSFLAAAISINLAAPALQALFALFGLVAHVAHQRSQQQT